MYEGGQAANLATVLAQGADPGKLGATPGPEGIPWVTEPVSTLLQTVLWVVLIAVFAWRVRSTLQMFLGIVIDRIRSGAAFETPWLTIKEAPEALRTGRTKLTTSEGESPVHATKDVEELLLNKQYPSGLIEEVYLVHEAEVIRHRSRRRLGEYTVRAWVEGYKEELLDDIERVTYRLYDDFGPRKIIATSARKQEFEIWLRVYGEFTVFAYVERKNKDPLWLTRYLDLPGRPPD